MQRAVPTVSESRIFLSPPHLSGREIALITEAINTNYIAPLGPHIDRFEAMLREITGFKNVLALSSGTAALHLAIRLADIGPGDEVWCPSMTFIGGIVPVMYQGATPRFFDCTEDSLIDLDLVERELVSAEKSGKLPKVLMIADLYGLTCDSVRAQSLASRFGFKLINDAAESLGSTSPSGRPSGSGAWAAGYSFNGNKIITTSGGGALASDDDQMISRARFLSAQARESAPHYQHETFGYNYRLSNICAALGCAQLEVLGNRVNRRRAIFDRYVAALAARPGFSFLKETNGSRANRWLTVMQVDPKKAGIDREQIRLALEKSDIESRPAWKPMHMQPVFANAPCVGGAVAERIFEQGLCLPSGSAMTDQDVDKVIAKIVELL